MLHAKASTAAVLDIRWEELARCYGLQKQVTLICNWSHHALPFRLENTKITETGKKCLEKASCLSRSTVEVTYTPNIHLQRRLENKTKDQSLNCGSSY